MSDGQIGNGTMHDFQAARIRELDAALAVCEKNLTALRAEVDRLRNELDKAICDISEGTHDGAMRGMKRLEVLIAAAAALNPPAETKENTP